MPRPKLDPAVLAARNSVNRNPARYGMAMPKSGGVLRRDRLKASTERRVVALVRRLQAQVKILLRLKLTTAELEELEERIQNDETVLGAVMDFESVHTRITVQVSEAPAGASWNEGRVLVRVRQDVEG